jgi:hypothetical protein
VLESVLQVATSDLCVQTMHSSKVVYTVPNTYFMSVNKSVLQYQIRCTIQTYSITSAVMIVMEIDKLQPITKKHIKLTDLWFPN